MAPPRASETSPLLGASTKSNGNPKPQGEANTSSSSGTQGQNAVENECDQEAERADEPAQGYEGMPEVRKRMHIIFPSMAVGVLLVMADQTLIVSSYGKIGTDLEALSMTSWIATGYFLTLTAFQPLYGKLSDIFSRKSCLLFAYTIFGLGSLACGLSPNIESLIAARAVTGIGGAGMFTVTSIILSDIIPLRERGTWQGYTNILAAFGSGAGAPLGGILADTVGWRWAFLAQAPLCAVAFTTVAIWMNLPKKTSGHWREKLQRVDFLGAFTLLLAIFGLLVALDRGSNVSWKDRYTLAALAVSIPLFAIFMFVEMRMAKEPFAPGHIVFKAELFACYLCNFFTLAAWMSVNFYIPLYWQVVRGVSAGQAGLQLVPPLICATIGSLLAGFYMKRRGIYKTWTILCCVALFMGTAIILIFAGAIRPFSSIWSTIGMIVGFSMASWAAGSNTTTLLIGLIANVDPADQAVATACSYLFRSLGSVVGVSISATVSNIVLRNSLRRALGQGDQATEIADRVRQSLDYLRKLQPDVKAVVVQCFAHSTRCVFAMQLITALLAIIMALYIREKRLGK